MTHDEVRNPFPGLRPFEFGDNHLFFGRDEQTTELTTRLRKNRFVAVVGTSGSGKSSLVRAGLMPELISGTMAGAGSSWETTIMRPGGDPITNLAAAIVEADLYDSGEEDIASQVRATLTRSGLGLVEAMRQSELPEGTNFLLVVDQFEEIFRFRRSDDATDEQAAFFVNLLLEASAQADLPLYVIITMRSDFLGECSQFPRLADTVNEGEFLIPRLNRDQRKGAIVGPVKVAGGEITDRLLLRLLNDIGDDPDQLPILQHALMRTWDLFEERGGDGALDLEHYQATGGMGEALSRHADEVYNELPDDEHMRIAQKLFKSLTEKVDANRGIRRPMQLAELHEICGGEEAHLRDVLDAFRKTGCTFLMPAGESEIKTKTVIDISHESLMRAWRSLRNWVDEEAQSAKIYRRLADTATLYHEDKAGLYRDPDLQIALSWRDENRPNKTWADRYYPGFDGAMAFLDQSHDEAIRDEREREEARQREVAQAKALADEQKRRATAQARVAKIFKLAGACLFVLLCFSLYSMNVAIESKKEVSEKIFQLAARSTAAAEKAIIDNDYYESMTWFNDASELSEGDGASQTYVSNKIKSFLKNIPVLVQAELLTEPIIDYKLNKNNIILIKRINNELFGIEEFNLSTKNLDSNKFKDIQFKWISFSENGNKYAYCDVNNTIHVVDKELENIVTNISGMPKASSFNLNGEILAIAIDSGETTIVFYSLKTMSKISQYKLKTQLNEIKLKYLSDNEVLVAGNYVESGQNRYEVSIFKNNNNKIINKYNNDKNGTITAFDISGNLKTYSLGLSIRSDQGRIIKTNTYDAKSGEIINSINHDNYNIKILDYDAAGFRLAIVDEDNNVSVLDISKQLNRKISGNLNSITSASFSPLGNHLVIISRDKGAHFIDTVTLKKSLPVFNLQGRLHFAAFSQNEDLVIVSATQGRDSGLFTLNYITSKEEFISAEMSSEWQAEWPYLVGDNWFFQRPTGGDYKTAEEWHGAKEYAFDGDETTMVHNDQSTDGDPYWIGELKTECMIKGIEIINRKFGPREQMANYLVTILDEKKNRVWQNKFLDSNHPTYRGPDKLNVQIEEDVVGKYIKVQCYANNPRHGRKIISFSEIYVWGGGGYYHLKNDELFELTSAINPYKLNDVGAIEMRSMIELNNNLYAISEKPYFKQIISQNAISPNKLFDGLKARYREKNWSSFISTYDHLVKKYDYSMTNYVDILYANALLEQKQYELAYNIYMNNIHRLKKNEQKNLILLSSQKNNEINNLIEKINIDELIFEYPEVSFFLDSDNSFSLDKVIENIDAKLPSYYLPDVRLSEKFYNSFLIELVISNDSSGEIISMGGIEYADGFTLRRQGNQIQFVITNKDTGVSKQIYVPLWRVPQSNQSNSSKHHIFWNSRDKTLNYMIGGLDVATVDFEGPLGKKHPPMIIGGDTIKHNYGNIKISSLKLWDKEVGADQILNTDIGEPIYELTPEVAVENGQSFNVTIAKEETGIKLRDEISKSDISFLEISNSDDKSNLLTNFLIKSALELLENNYGDSSKYLKHAFELNQGENYDHLQFYIGSMLLQKIEDPELKAYMGNIQMAKSTNWKFEYILNSLTKKLSN